MKTISLGEIEALIRNKIKSKGLDTSISEDKIQEIKHKIKHRMGLPSTGVFYMAPKINNDDNDDNDTNGDGLIDVSNVGLGDTDGGMEEQTVTMPVDNQSDDAVTQTTTVDTDIAHKEGELSQKEQEIAKREQELNLRQMELDRKEQELKYKPQLPEFILKSQPAQLFIYDRNELSMGAESLSNMKYSVVGSPDTKKSMHELWIEEGKIKAEIFKVELQQIGVMEFDPTVGTCRFVEMTSPMPGDLPTEEKEGVQQAIDSQMPIEPMIDSVAPVIDVTLPASPDMGLNTPDVQKSMMDVVERALMDYLRKKGLE